MPSRIQQLVAALFVIAAGFLVLHRRSRATTPEQAERTWVPVDH